MPVLAVRANYSDSNEQVISVKITNVTFGLWRMDAGMVLFLRNVEGFSRKKSRARNEFAWPVSGAWECQTGYLNLIVCLHPELTAFKTLLLLAMPQL